MTIYHALKSRGVFETWEYDFIGTIKAFYITHDFRGLLKFLKLCRLTEKSCDKLCKKLNKNMEGKQ